jgi:signal transduction histidine kinase/DNA-binding NarL/FixJ family response regulator
MPLLETKDLLDQLSQLENSLNDFSYQNLNSKEATSLKKSFSSFRSTLEQKIYEPNTPILENDEAALEGGDPKVNLFMAHVSHEIRTPLNGIIGFIHLMKEEGLSETQMERALAIESASAYLMDIINEVLDYTKLSSGNESFKCVSFNIKGLVKDVLFLCRTLLLQKEVQLKYTIDPKVPQVLMGDPSKLSQVLLNLMGNAIKFVEKGHVHLTIAHEGQKDGFHQIQFCVEDTGIGFSKEQLPHVFESFQQVKTGFLQNDKGAGLGLSIVKQIINQQGGQISVASTLGKGTRFTFTIPYKNGSGQPLPHIANNTISLSLGKRLLNGTEILVFEDNLLNQRLIQEQLKKWGCKVFITEDLEEGLDILRLRPINLILMDLKMPKMTGFEVSRKIRSIPRDKGGAVPIVALSADFTGQDKEQCQSAGINDFLLKPYTLEELFTKVVRHKKEAYLPKESINLLQQPVIEHYNIDTINLDSLLEDCFGKVDMLEELIRLLKQNIYEFIGATKMSLEIEDYETIALAAHKLKAGLTMVHAYGLKDIVVQLEEHSKKKQREQVELLYHSFLRNLPSVETTLDCALTKLKNG